jgi:hypothetical protein
MQKTLYIKLIPMKLDIIYRCYNAELNNPGEEGYVPSTGRVRPIWYDKIRCLQTFITAVEYASDITDRIIFLHDGPKGKLYDKIPSKYEIVCINELTDGGSLAVAHNIADQLTNHIYFAEDDYLHLQTSVKIVYDGLETFNLVTPYDHLHRYINDDDITKGRDYIAFSRKTNCHWRTSESTCNSWATTRAMWNGIVGQLAKQFRPYDRDLFRTLFTQHNIRLWNPIPGVTTQVDENMSPGVDWEKFAIN